MKTHSLPSSIKIAPGNPLPLGATVSEKGVQFSLFSRHATSIILQLFSSSKDTEPSHEITLDPESNKTGDLWHIFIEGIKPGQLYGYRADGPYRPREGMRFNKNKLLLDPFTRAVTGNFNWDLSDARSYDINLSLIHISEPTRLNSTSRMPSSA
mgnify:CR=1 FL=1